MEKNSPSSKSSLALGNLRAVAIVFVLAVHSLLAYLGSATPGAFDRHPYLWRAVPIVDSHRWLGFDIFCAWQDVYLMVLLFFLSGLFTWSSLVRKGEEKFLGDRCLRLGIPYLFGVIVLMPLALYPVYQTRAPADAGVAAYVHHLFALPFWDNGPMWFLWQLLALTLVAAALHRCAPRLVEALGNFSANAGRHPGRYILWLSIAAVLAYVPLALAFTPMAWLERGPLSLQFCRPLIYLVFYLAGLGVGVRGCERGLLAADGALARGWAGWLVGASLAFALWLALMGLLMAHPASVGLNIVTDIAFALAATSGCFAALALSLRFLGSRSTLLDALAKNGFGLYVVHYPIAVWLQYAFLGLAVFAFAKAMIVFALTMLLSLAVVAALRLVPVFGARLLGETRKLMPSGLPRSRMVRPTATIPLASNFR